jgi:NADPH2:quinone reductase
MSDLPQTMRALVIDAPGAAPRVETRPVPSPGPGEVLVRIAASPINPSDLMTVQGLYGVDWTFPLVAGLEGSGRVVARGDGLLAKYLDNRNVACVADKQGLWAEYAVTKAARCLALPADMPLGPAAMSFVNPLDGRGACPHGAARGARIGDLDGGRRRAGPHDRGAGQAAGAEDHQCRSPK